MKRIISLLLVLMLIGTMAAVPVQAAETVTITFRGNGGVAADGTATATQQTTSGTSTRLNTNPFLREGYTFTGWSTNAASAAGVYADGQAVGVSQDITLYAIWQLNVYELTIVGVEGLAGGEVEYGTDLSGLLPANPQRTGYRFTGWTATNAAGEPVAVPSVMPAYDLTITAGWEERGATYILTILNDEGEVITTYAYAEGDPIQPPEIPIPEGMRLKGWRNAETGRIQALPAVMPAYDMEFLAVIEDIYYTVTFMDGTAEVGEVTAYYGEKAMFIERPAQSGKVFLGWSTDPAATEAEYIPWQEIELEADMTVYAVWANAESTVTFMNGETEIGELTAAYGETVTLIDGPQGCLGWSTEPDATEPEYTAGQSVTLTGDLTLYAVMGPTAPTISLKYPTLVFEDEILMNVYYAATDLSNVTEMGLITYSQEVTEWNVDNAEAVIPGYTWSDSDQLYYSTTEGIAAKCLGDTIYFAVYYKLSDGTYGYTGLAGYSPKTYAYNQLKTGSAEMKPIVVAMLKYGAAAQSYFSYNTDNPVNAELTEEQNALVEAYRSDMMGTVVQASGDKLGEMVKTGGYVNRYPTISFEGAFCINYYFQPSAVPVGDITMYVWNQKDFNAAETLTKANATDALTMTAAGEEYLAIVEGIAAKDLDRGIYVSFCYSDGTTEYCSGVIGYSIGMYCNAQAAKTGTLADLAAATAVYGYYARELFYKEV